MKRKIQLTAILISFMMVVTTVPLWGQAANPSAVQVQNQNQKQKQHTIQDKNGDGVCDVCGQATGSGQQNSQGKKAKKGKHWGPGDGTGNQQVGPQDGTGYGSGSGKKMGPQDGSGQGKSQKGQRGSRGGSRGRPK